MEPRNLGVLFQDRLHNLSLDPDSTTVDDPHFPKPPFHRLIEVFLYHDSDFSRLKCVQIDRVLNRDLVHSIQYNCAL